MSRSVIIVAGGKGERMNNSRPKQFLLLHQRPILFHTIQAFKTADSDISIILVLPADHLSTWEDLRQQYEFSTAVTVIEGGKTRFHSVKNGLQTIEGEGIIGVHDGVRPLVSPSLIRKCYEETENHKSAVPVLPLRETLRYVEEDRSETVNRDHYRTVQTPQCFDSHLLKRAYQQSYDTKFTDDASVVEETGHSPHLITGERTNLKITTPFDREMAEFLFDRL